MNTKSPLLAVILFTLSVLGAACSATTLPTHGTYVNARLDTVDPLDRATAHAQHMGSRAGSVR